MQEETPPTQSSSKKLFGKIVQSNEASLEARLLASFTWKDFEDLGLPAFTYPKMFRGLPRFYHKASACKASIKKPFSTFFQLKKQYIDKAKLYLYHDVTLRNDVQITILAKIQDEESAFSLQDLIGLLQDTLGCLPVKVCGFFSENFSSDSLPIPVEKTTYSSKKTLLFSKQQKKLLQQSDLLLQYPNYFPEIQSVLHYLDLAKVSYKYELLGKIGSMQELPFLQTGRCFGLHFLEKGLLIYPEKKPLAKQLLQLSIASTILGKNNPTEKDVEDYFSRTKCNYFSPRSNPVFFSAVAYVLHKHKNTKKTLDFFLPKTFYSDNLVKHAQKLCLENGFGHLCIEGKKEEQYYSLSKKKGRVRFVFLEHLSRQEQSFLIHFTTDFLLVKNSWEFVRALTVRVPNFYDASIEEKSFIKDLISLGQYYLPQHPKAISYLRTFLTFLGKTKPASLYVEEDFFQESNEKQILFFEEMLDQKTILALFRLYRVILHYFSANPFVISLVKRAILHKTVPKVCIQEKKLEEEYFYGNMPFAMFIEQLRKVLFRYK